MKNLNITETPEEWVIIQIPSGYKVFASWRGGYLTGDRWKANSGIADIKQDKDFYYFIGHSGSCYKCHKKGYGITSNFGLNLLNRILDTMDVKLLEDCDNWETELNLV